MFGEMVPGIGLGLRHTRRLVVGVGDQPAACCLRSCWAKMGEPIAARASVLRCGHRGHREIAAAERSNPPSQARRANLGRGRPKTCGGRFCPRSPGRLPAWRHGYHPPRPAPATSVTPAKQRQALSRRGFPCQTFAQRRLRLAASDAACRPGRDSGSEKRSPSRHSRALGGRSSSGNQLERQTTRPAKRCWSRHDGPSRQHPWRPESKLG